MYHLKNTVYRNLSLLYMDKLNAFIYSRFFFVKARYLYYMYECDVQICRLDYKRKSNYEKYCCTVTDKFVHNLTAKTCRRWAITKRWFTFLWILRRYITCVRILDQEHKTMINSGLLTEIFNFRKDTVFNFFFRF